MKPSEIIKLARRQTWCTLDVVTEEEAYQFLNFIIEDFGADIRSSESWFGFDILTLDVYENQPMYTFDEDYWEYSQNFPISKIQSVWLLDQKTNKWRDIPVHFVDKMNPNDFDSKSEPMVAFVTRSDITLVPVPKENTRMMIWGWNYNYEFTVIPWLQVGLTEYRRAEYADLTGKTYPYAWDNWALWTVYTSSETPSNWATMYTYDSGTDTFTSAWTLDKYLPNVLDKEEFIWIPKRWHYIVVEGMKYRMYGNMWSNFETLRTASRNFYDSEKMKALQNIMDRGQKADTWYYPEENYDPLEWPNLDYLIY